MGPQSAQDSVRKALAMGADSALLITDDAAAGSDLVATATALAAALEPEAADLILFGQQSSDSDGAVLWAAVADKLRRPVISQVAELTVTDGKVTGKRQTEFGYDTIGRPAPGGRRCLRRDQRAALPLAQGDHGSALEASALGLPLGARCGCGERGRSGIQDSRPGTQRPAAARGYGQDRGRRERR